MPSDELIQAALKALSDPAERFRSEVARAADEVRGMLDAAAVEEGGGTAATRLAGELGEFAAGRIDPARLTGLLARGPVLDRGARQVLEAAREVLAEVAFGPAPVPEVVGVEPGASLYAAVDGALARAGRAFGAARVVAEARRQGTRPRDAERRLAALPFREWSAPQRAVAPPLVVDVEGKDLSAGSLAEFLDGAVRIVLVVRGPCAPAPLARLITPGTWLLQTSDPERLSGIGDAAGPAVAALVPETAARFLHDPRRAPGERLQVEHLPTSDPRGRLGGMGARQQTEELRLLAELAARSGAPGAGALSAPRGNGKAGGPEAPEAGPPEPEASAPGPASDPASRLAAWLLEQADLGGPPG